MVKVMIDKNGKFKLVMSPMEKSLFISGAADPITGMYHGISKTIMKFNKISSNGYNTNECAVCYQRGYPNCSACGY